MTLAICGCFDLGQISAVICNPGAQLRDARQPRQPMLECGWKKIFSSRGRHPDIRRRTMRQLQWIAVCLIACVASGLSLAAEPSPHSILVLDEANVRGPFYYAVFSALRSTVEAGRGPVTIYAESLDLSRFGGTDYEESLEAHLRVKYRDRPVDVIVAIGSATLDFALRNRKSTRLNSSHVKISYAVFCLKKKKKKKIQYQTLIIQNAKNKEQ